MAVVHPYQLIERWTPMANLRTVFGQVGDTRAETERREAI